MFELLWLCMISSVNDKKLLKFIRVMPVLIIAFATLLVVGVIFRDNKLKSLENLASLRQDYLLQQKNRIKQEVNSVYRQIKYERKHTEDRLKQDIKVRIYEAHDIAMAVYQKNKNKSEEELTKLITTALRALRFNNGRGYYFIYKMNGVNVMLPPLPHMEGTSRWDMQDSRGSFITRDVVNIAKNQGEGYHRWWFYKPGNSKQDFEKVGFVKYFAPLNWAIGTGEYIEDFEQQVKEQLLKRISEIRYGVSGYVFIIENDGTILAHENKAIVNNKAMDFKDKNDNEYIKDIINVATIGDGFVNYSSQLIPGVNEESDKLSYVRGVPEWGWVLGSGFYMSDVESFLSEKENAIRKQNQSKLIMLFFYCAILVFIMTILATLLSKKIATRLETYQSKIKKDIVEIESVRDKMQQLALYDSLTELPNRIHFTQLLDGKLVESDTNNKILAVVLVGIDDFKKINDLYSHKVGDQLLIKLSREFESILDKQDSVSRFGGDEFSFCFRNANDKEEIESKVDRIQKSLNKDIHIDGILIKFNCSIGVSCFPRDALTSEELISHADIALYLAKSDKKGGTLFFNSSIAKKLEYDFKVEQELKGAIERDEISLVYQPQICAVSGQLKSVEALCRWKNRVLGCVSPIEFIEVAERTDLIHSIGQFVTKKACDDIVAYFPNGRGAIKLSINISPKQFKLTSFTSDFFEIIEESGIDSERVTIEITENILLNDQESINPILQEFRRCGFGISLDDFGTGYSSLSYLNNLPINEIKIDRSFVDKLFLNKQSDSLIKAILAIGKSCNMTVVAEGVETPRQHRKLVEYQCDLMQGYYFDKPLLLEELCSRSDTWWQKE